MEGQRVQQPHLNPSLYRQTRDRRLSAFRCIYSSAPYIIRTLLINNDDKSAFSRLQEVRTNLFHYTYQAIIKAK